MTDKTAIKTIISNGDQFNFHVILDTTSPCPHCGVPACGREDIIWYEDMDKRKAIVFDGGYLDLAIGEFLTDYLPEAELSVLPEFLRQWNESVGWADCDSYEGYEISADDFITAMEFLKIDVVAKWMAENELTSLQQLAREAKKHSSVLRIVRG